MRSHLRLGESGQVDLSAHVEVLSGVTKCKGVSGPEKINEFYSLLRILLTQLIDIEYQLVDPLITMNVCVTIHRTTAKGLSSSYSL